MTHTINANLKHTPSSGPFNCSSLQTISIETGLQNGGVPFFMIQMALTSPDLELATIPIVYVSALTPVPMLTICLCYMLYNKVKAKVSLQNSLVYQILSFTSILSGAHRYLSVLCKYFSPKTTFFLIDNLYIKQCLLFPMCGGKQLEIIIKFLVQYTTLLHTPILQNH